MLIILNGGEWLKRYLAYPFYGRVEHGSPILGLDFASLMRGYFSLFFYVYYIDLYVDYHCFLYISIFIMLVMYVFHDGGYVWLSSCFYL